MAYGGPQSLDDVEPYLMDVRGGRATPRELVEEVRSRYARIGGRSPITERTREQADALERRLHQQGRPVRAYVGMRHWHPYIDETFRQIVTDGVTHLVALAMAPHYSRMSVGAYIRKVEEARARSGRDLHISFVRGFHDHPLFLRAVAEKVQAALDRYPAAERAAVAVVFTAHSLPERILQEGDPYQQQFLDSAQRVAARLGLGTWRWAYQSQGSTRDKWLGPDVGAVLDELQAAGRSDALIVPIGFVCDHVEVLYDLDIYYRDYAAAKGLRLARTESLNASPAFVEALADVVRAHW
jgi:ferrochelatase